MSALVCRRVVEIFNDDNLFAIVVIPPSVGVLNKEPVAICSGFLSCSKRLASSSSSVKPIVIEFNEGLEDIRSEEIGLAFAASLKV
jgi:hypothetical protein